MSATRGDTVTVITNARLTGADRLDPFGSALVDLHLSGGQIADIAPAAALPRHGLQLDAEGGWVIPGLWDHHVHTLAWALTAPRVALGEATTAAETVALMAAAPVQEDGRRIGVGFRDAMWAEPASLELLDAATGEVPTYLINADLHSVWLNSAAQRREDVFTDSSGLLREEPAFMIGRRLNDVDPAVGDAFVAQAAAAAAARGVVGIVDLDMAWNPQNWQRRGESGFNTLRVHAGIYPEYLDRAITEGLRSGDALDPAGLLRIGPFKVITDGSLGTRTAACSHAYPGDPHNRGLLTVSSDELVELLIKATGAGLASAVHAIGDVANSHALDAFAETGAYGTIEHAQLVAHADIPRFARLGVAASIQPQHAVDDRDLTDSIWAGQTALAYPLRAFVDAGANLLFGSDAPVSPLDPWAAMAAAVFRTIGDRPAWRGEQSIDIATALAASTGGGSLSGSALEPGDTADLAICDRDPLTANEAGLRSTAVSATMIEGRLTHRV